MKESCQEMEKAKFLLYLVVGIVERKTWGPENSTQLRKITSAKMIGWPNGMLGKASRAPFDPINDSHVGMLNLKQHH